MLPKISFQTFLINILPGGFFVSMLILYVNYYCSSCFDLLPDYEFLPAFIFIFTSFTAGEVLQTVAHLPFIEGLIDIFFKGKRPSEIFLLPNNPVIDERKRQKIICDLEIQKKDRDQLKSYKSVSFFEGKKGDCFLVCQNAFWEMYAQVCNNEKIQIANAKYLFCRVMFLMFLVLSFIFLAIKIISVSIFFGVLTLLFLYRARGCARGLVRDVIYSFNHK